MFSEIKRSKMLKLMHNLRCCSNFAKRCCYWIPLAKITLEGPKVGDFIGDFYQQTSQNFVTLPCGKGRPIIFMEYISHVHCNAKNCVFIAAILSKLHAPWQLVMQGYVIGLTTLKGLAVFPDSPQKPGEKRAW